MGLSVQGSDGAPDPTGTCHLFAIYLRRASSSLFSSSVFIIVLLMYAFSAWTSDPLPSLSMAAAAWFMSSISLGMLAMYLSCVLLKSLVSSFAQTRD